MKVCKKCKQDLSLDRFYIDNGGGKYGVRSVCIKCFNNASYNYRKSIPGLVTQIYARQRRNSLLRNHPYPDYNKSQLMDWITNNPIFINLYNNWVSSGYDRLLVPSCDRIDSRGHYTLDNLQLGTFAENHKNENMEIMNGLIGRSIAVIGTSKDTGQKILFVSAKDAERRIGAFSTHISACCRGKRNSAGNFTWRFAE